jgi:riboflavin kinase/FMN adenylyltransferase
MEIVRSLGAFSRPGEGCAVAVGNFDGLHRGHRKILEILLREARRRGLRAYVLTFSPHPEKVFGSSKILMLQTLEQRLERLARFKLDGALVVPFRRSFAELTAKAFAQKILHRTIGARLIVVGADFRFGRGREGDADLLIRIGRTTGFEVVSVPQLRRRGEVVSSSLIRARLAAGDVERANDLLGWPYEIEGDVVRGVGRGGAIGYPTANLETPNEILPRGVFLTEFRLTGARLPSVTNVGFRPTFGRTRLTVESHILDWNGDLTGAAVRLAFLSKLRDEKAFPGPEELASQLRKDVAAARRYFNREHIT